MPNITIPIKKRFTESMNLGIKVRIWKIQRYGKEGDTFNFGSITYKIVRINRACMGSVPAYYREEGFLNSEDAIQTLKESFPTNGYEPDRMGWAHWFEKVI